ncbi:MAG: D-aminoacylase [Planctomycetes bacterium]|nr:D-aminoacylase [Planctomycetota bacterium]
MFDVVIRNGQVIDGSGKDRFSADVAIQGDRIVKIGKVSATEANRIIEADGMIVAPGFIDIHAHEYSEYLEARLDSRLRQGVTTEVIGNCGESLAPVIGEGIEVVKNMLKTFGQEAANVDVPWSSMTEHLDYMDKRGVITNYAMLVGNGTIRAAVIGLDDRKATSDELEEMKKLLAQAMEEGAWGLSSGLIYLPSMFADTAELIELAKVSKQYGGIYASHIRGEHDPLLYSAIAEAIEIGRKAGISVEIAHLKLYGKQLWGKAEEILKMLDDARSEGIDVEADTYPYTASHTTLSAILPDWMQGGGTEKMVERLNQPELRKKAREEITAGKVIFFKGIGWEDVKITHSDLDETLDGKSIAQIAQLRQKDPCETAFDLLADDPTLRAIYFAMNEDDVRTILKHPHVKIGSDSYALSSQSRLAKGKPHPRCYGTFPRVLGKYAREEKLFTLEQAIQKMTSLSAQKIGIPDRGVLKENAYADIVVFDPETVRDKATFENPHQYPAGIEFVILNGQVVVENGQYNGKLAGKTLRRGKQ